jgi:hypothetical protein
LTVLTPERGEEADSTYRAAATRWGAGREQNRARLD